MPTQQNHFGSATVVTSLFAVLLFSAPAFAVDIVDDPIQIDERATQLLQVSNSLCWEIYRFHQQQPEFPQTYRSAKEIWSRAGELRNALRSGLVETENLLQQVAQIHELFTQVENSLSKWGDGDRSLVAPNVGTGPQTVMTPGVGIDIPFVGVRVGTPRVAVIEESVPQLERRRLHPNSHGSKRSLERELAAVKVAMNDLREDAGITAVSAPPLPSAPRPIGPVPQPPQPAPVLGEPQKIQPSAAKKADASSGNK